MGGSGGGCSFIPPTVEPNEQSERKFFVDSISGLLICTRLPPSPRRVTRMLEIKRSEAQIPLIMLIPR